MTLGEPPDVVVFGDAVGVPQVLDAVPRRRVAAIVAAGNRPQYHGRLADVAGDAAVPLLVQPGASDERYPGFVAGLHRLAPRYILVNSYSMRLQPDVLAIPTDAAVNVHGALLPAYRGANPLEWALINDERETGVTMHHMTDAFDEGDIVSLRKVPVAFHETWVDVRSKVHEATAELLAEEVPRLLGGTAIRIPQDPERAGYFHRRSADDGLIDWSAPVLRIYNLVRALVAPHPGAFYENGTTRVHLRSWLPVADVAAMKYGPIGGQLLRAQDWRGAVKPAPGGGRRTERNAVVRIHLVGETAVRLELHVDWTTRTVEVGASDGPAHDLPPGASEAVARFLSDDLGLAVRPVP